MLTIPDGRHLALIYASRNRKRKFSTGLSATDLLGQRLDGDDVEARTSASSHKFVERLLRKESLSQAEIDELVCDRPSGEELQRRVNKATRDKAPIDQMFSPMPGQSTSPVEAMMASRFGIRDPARFAELGRRTEAKTRAQHEEDRADPCGTSQRARARAFRWFPDILDSMKLAHDMLPLDERKAPNPISAAYRAEIRRIAEASAHLCRNAPQLARDEFEAEFSNPQWREVKAVKALRDLPTAGGAISTVNLVGPAFGMMVTGLLWQIAVFEACCWLPDHPVCWLFIIPEPSDKAGYRCGPQWVELMMGEFAPAPSSSEEPRRRGRHPSRCHQIASCLVGADHISATSPKTRAKELRDLASGKADLNYARVERLSLEVGQALSVGLAGQERDNRIAEIREPLRFVGHVAGMLEHFQCAIEDDPKVKDDRMVLDHLRAAWDDFPKLRKAALAFRAQALREAGVTPATEATGV
jgi:hypothetical protein